MNWNNVDWDNFSCVDMQRQIRSKIAKERAGMSIVEYLRQKRVTQSNTEKSKNITSVPSNSVVKGNYIET